jgi:hypothetical protein
MANSYSYWLKTTALVTLIGVVSVALPQTSFAQDTEACKGADMTEDELQALLDAFGADPEAFLEDVCVEDLAAVLTADPGSIDTVIAIAETTNPDAAGLVGEAAAQAVANLDSQGDQGLASDIQTAVATSASGDMVASFSETSGDIAAAAGQDDQAALGALPGDDQQDDVPALGGTDPGAGAAGDDGGAVADDDDDGGGSGATGGGGGFSTSGGGGDDDDDDDPISPG